jgi:Cu+-exporting ATPase
MSCGKCAARVERLLKADPGVLSAEVTLASGEAKVRFEPSTTLDALLVRVTAGGYGVVTREGG